MRARVWGDSVRCSSLSGREREREGELERQSCSHFGSSRECSRLDLLSSASFWGGGASPSLSCVQRAVSLAFSPALPSHQRGVPRRELCSLSRGGPERPHSRERTCAGSAAYLHSIRDLSAAYSTRTPPARSGSASTSNGYAS